MRIRRVAASLAVVTVMVAGLAVDMTPATAATGDTVSTIVADRGADSACKSTNQAGDHGGVGTGIAFDGTNLILSCWSSNELVFVNPTTGAFVKRVLATNGSNFGAMAYDGVGNVLYVCDNRSDVGSVDLATNTYTKLFTSAGCVDGLAFDGSDNTIWTSPDASSPVSHYTTSGTLIAAFPVSLGGYGNSGLAVGGATIYLGNNGGGEIFQSDKTLANPTVFIGTAQTGGRRVEDLECDNVTFLSQAKAVIWSQDAYDNILTAYEIPNGSCAYGGGVVPKPEPVPEPVPEPAPAPVATSAAPAAAAVTVTPAFTG